MPKVTQAHLDARRDQFLRAARACFGRRGFHTTTVQEIAEEAGLSPGALYRYFDTKSAIIEALAEAARGRMVELTESLAATEPPERSLRETFELFCDGVLGDMPGSDPGVDLRLWAEALEAPALRRVVLAWQRAALEPLTERVRWGQERGEVDPWVPAEGMARALIALLQGLIVQAALQPDADRAPAREAIGALLDGG